METNTTAFRIKAIIKLFLALALILIGGTLTGLVFAGIGSFFYMTIIFPGMMGIAGGALVYRALRLTNLRKPALVIGLCVLTAGVIYGSLHYGRYIALQAQTFYRLTTEGMEGPGEPSLVLVNQMWNALFEGSTGHSGFPGFILYQAKTGISVGRFYHENPTVLKSYLAWLYWVFEFSLILYLTQLIGRAEVHLPVCEACGRRLGREQHLGGTVPANERLLLELIRRNDLAGLGDLLEKDAGLPSVEVYLRRCESCGQGVSHLTVRRAYLGAKGGVELADVSKVTLQPGDSRRFLSQLRFEVE